MAAAPQLPDATRQNIADQIGRFLPPPVGDDRNLDVEGVLLLAESLPVLMLPLEDLQRNEGVFSEMVRFTGRWHHQVASPVGFAAARSLQHGAEHEVVEVTTSTIPDDLARTIKWVDDNLPGDQLATMLIVPSYYLTAIMLRSAAGDQVVVSQRPDRLAEIETDHVYAGREFVETLRRYPPSTGIPEGQGVRG